jgi:hypothetical protein
MTSVGSNTSSQFFDNSRTPEPTARKRFIAQIAGLGPTPSRPDPKDLDAGKTVVGMVGDSPNQTGLINNAAELAQAVFAGYNGGKWGPIAIVPATLTQKGETENVHLVTISGTEGVAGQATGWSTNFKSSAELGSTALENAKAAIRASAPFGSTLVLAGHSQGGMLAQQLAADPDIKAEYNIRNVTTFGSPQIGIKFYGRDKREGTVHRFTAWGDPVPRTGFAQTFLPVQKIMGWVSQKNIPTRTAFEPLKTHNTAYKDETNAGLMNTGALGDVGDSPSSLEFDPADRVFWTSPSK